MATVYLAEDLKHDRKVAIKVLHPELSAVIGGERFLTEIKTTASLQHPHILGLIDSGAADGLLYYVMPFVEGETLRGWLVRERQLPVDAAVRIAKEVASALEFAHKRGVVHRDIKPENILLQDGQALVADFGIALAVQQAGGSRMTQTGMRLGTPAYMSPEQAMGDRDIGPRSDVYALGAMTYEMLAGEPPFIGPSSQAIVAKVLTENPPPLRPKRPTVPPAVEAAVLTALQKLPADRFGSAKEFIDALEGSGKGVTYPATVAMPAAHPATRASRALVYGLAAALLGTAALAAWGWLRPEPPRPVSRYGLAFAEGQAPLGRVAITPDGSRLVYQGPGDSAQQRQLWVKRRDEYQATPLPGTTNPGAQIISPDGEWIAFGQGFQLKKIPITGGAVTTLADSVNGGDAMAWLDDGTIVYVQRGTFNLMRVVRDRRSVHPAPGAGSPGAVAGVSCRTAARPRRALHLVHAATASTGDLWVLDLESGDARVLLPGERQGGYLRLGARRVRREGRAGLRGTLRPEVAHLPQHARAGPRRRRDGAERPRPEPHRVVHRHAGAGGRRPDRRRVRAAAYAGVGGPDGHAAPRRLGVDLPPLASGWQRRLVALTGRDAARRRAQHRRGRRHLDQGAAGRSTLARDVRLSRRSAPPVDAGRALRDLPQSTGRAASTPRRRHRSTEIPLAPAGRAGSIERLSGRRDGRWLVFRTGGGQAGRRAGYPRAPARRRQRARAARGEARRRRIGARAVARRKWLAYESDETGRTEIYVRPFPATDSGKWQVSTNGGQAPLWAHSGRELFFVDAERNMVAAPVQGGAEFRLGARRTLFHLGEDLYLAGGEHYTPFDLSRDDQRFLMARALRRGERHAFVPAGRELVRGAEGEGEAVSDPPAAPAALSDSG